MTSICCTLLSHSLSLHLCFVGEETASEKNTFVLRLQVTCKRHGTQMVNDRGTNDTDFALMQ